MPYGTPTAHESNADYLLVVSILNDSEGNLEVTVKRPMGANSFSDSFVQDLIDFINARSEVDTVTSTKTYPTVKEITAT